MTVKELIQQLKQLPLEATVIAEIKNEPNGDNAQWVTQLHDFRLIAEYGIQISDTTHLWIARDPSGELAISRDKPKLKGDWMAKTQIGLDKSLFPFVTFENSPQKVELKIIDDEKERI